MLRARNFNDGFTSSCAHFSVPHLSRFQLGGVVCPLIVQVPYTLQYNVFYYPSRLTRDNFHQRSVLVLELLNFALRRLHLGRHIFRARVRGAACRRLACKLTQGGHLGLTRLHGRLCACNRFLVVSEVLRRMEDRIWLFSVSEAGTSSEMKQRAVD